MFRFGSSMVRFVAKASVAGATAAMLTGCGSATDLDAVNDHPTGAESSRAAVVGFLEALERRDVAGMRQMMTPMAQRNETDVEGGLLREPPKLTSFTILRFAKESPRNNASPSGSIASLRYTVALTPPDGFDNDDTSGSAFGILVAETPGNRWFVAELGGCC